LSGLAPVEMGRRYRGVGAFARFDHIAKVTPLAEAR
jgi:hypothetical protein